MSAPELPWNESGVPSILPALTVSPTPGQLFMFSAATWNRHHIHYSAQAARAEGHPDVVVQRGLIGNYLARLITRWLGDRGELRALSWKVRRSAVPGRPLRCEGQVTARREVRSGRHLCCSLRVVDADGNLVAEGAAEVELTSENGR